MKLTYNMHGLQCSTSIVLAVPLLFVGSICPAQQQVDASKEPLQIDQNGPWQRESDLAPTRWSLGNVQLPRLVQRPSASGSLVADGNSDGLDTTEFSTSASIMVPDLLFLSGSLISLTLSFSVMFVDGPSGVHLPSELYRTGATIGWMKRPNDRISYNLGISPSVASDFETSDNAFRITAHAMMTYQWRPDVQFMLGAVYLNRNDISVLPMAGIVWTPSEDLRVELAAPRPRVSRRIQVTSDCGISTEHWLYFAGEFGGGTWGVERSPGRTDELTFRDFRLVFGYESKSPGRINSRAEIGYVFGRKVEYESDGAEFEPGNALMMRAGFSF